MGIRVDLWVPQVQC